MAADKKTAFKQLFVRSGGWNDKAKGLCINPLGNILGRSTILRFYKFATQLNEFKKDN